MRLSQLALLVALGVSTLLSGAFVISSFHERKHRAAGIGAIPAVIGVVLVVIFGAYWMPPDWLSWTITAGFVLSVLLFFLPFSSPAPLRTGPITEQVDERDTMFAREEYEPGTEIYETYYASHPDKKAVDDRLRGLPPILSPGGRFYDPVVATDIQAVFDTIRQMTADVDGELSKEKVVVLPEVMTARVKQLVRDLGADEVGIARLDPMFVYSHVGRGPEPWGAKINNSHAFAVVYTLKMDYARVEEAPDLPITEESARQYLRAAQISVALARHIRKLGYSARAHISDSNYQIMLPPVAQDAGLGEVGRLGYLISGKYGARVRLGGVTTNLPLVIDHPKPFGVQNFCRSCNKCAVNCPSNAIPSGEKTEVRGIEKWQLDVEKCLYTWRVFGTDCGLCMRVCPYSHPPTPVHNLVRRGIRRSPFARWLSVRADDLFYGRYPT
jgi:reductive dehalogenase